MQYQSQPLKLSDTGCIACTCCQFKNWHGFYTVNAICSPPRQDIIATYDFHLFIITVDKKGTCEKRQLLNMFDNDSGNGV